MLIQANPAAIPQALRFYDPEIQNAINAEPFDRERSRAADLKALQLFQSYLKQLESLRGRLDAKAYARFSAERQPLFDSNLLEFTVGDAVGGKLARRGWVARTTAVAKFLSFDFKTVHALTYRGIRTACFELPAERWFDHGGHDIDSLLHNELTGLGGKLMRHRFLFVSGATIDLTFEKVVWTTKKSQRPQ